MPILYSVPWPKWCFAFRQSRRANWHWHRTSLDRRAPPILAVVKRFIAIKNGFGAHHHCCEIFWEILESYSSGISIRQCRGNNILSKHFKITWHDVRYHRQRMLRFQCVSRLTNKHQWSWRIRIIIAITRSKDEASPHPVALLLTGAVTYSRKNFNLR